MTVSELRKILEAFPDDMLVATFDEGYLSSENVGVHTHWVTMKATMTPCPRHHHANGCAVAPDDADAVQVLVIN